MNWKDSRKWHNSIISKSHEYIIVNYLALIIISMSNYFYHYLLGLWHYHPIFYLLFEELFWSNRRLVPSLSSATESKSFWIREDRLIHSINHRHDYRSSSKILEMMDSDALCILDHHHCLMNSFWNMNLTNIFFKIEICNWWYSFMMKEFENNWEMDLL